MQTSLPRPATTVVVTTTFVLRELTADEHTAVDSAVATAAATHDLPLEVVACTTDRLTATIADAPPTGTPPTEDQVEASVSVCGRTADFLPRLEALLSDALGAPVREPEAACLEQQVAALPESEFQQIVTDAMVAPPIVGDSSLGRLLVACGLADG